jgi:pyruvate dehydrogenase E1 component alpha subunit
MATIPSNSNFDFRAVPASVHSQQTAGPAPGPEVVASPSDPNVLRKLYSAMLRCRMFEQRAGEVGSAGKRHSSLLLRIGLEGTSVGSMMDLRAGDAVSSERNVVSQLMAGLPMGLVLAELYGLRSEYLSMAPDAANSMIHLLPGAETVEARLNFAAGYAMALRRAACANVVLVHLPDGFSGLGFWHETAKVASAERLPLIFVAVSESITPKGGGVHTLRERAAAYGIPGIIVDGDDVVAVWRVVQESIHRARSGCGPTLIHSQIIGPTNSHGSLAARDPIARMQHYLQTRKLWDESWKRELVQKFIAELDKAVSAFGRVPERWTAANSA